MSHSSISKTEELEDALHGLLTLIEIIKETKIYLEEELLKPHGDRSGIITRALKDYIVIKTFILFDQSGTANLSLYRLPITYKQNLNSTDVKKYNTALDEFVQNHKDDIGRIRIHRNKSIAHLDKSRHSIFGFDQDSVTKLAQVGVTLRQANDYKHQYFQAEDLVKISLLNDLDILKEMLDAIKK